jgi:uncharacterized protein YdaT
MPWTAKTFRERHNHSLTDAEAAVAAEIANAVLKRTGSEARAVRAANSAVKKNVKKKTTRSFRNL